VRLVVVLALCVQLLHPLAAMAQTKTDPLSYPLKHYGVVLCMTLLGGFAGWYMKVRKGEIPGASLFSLIGEMATSSLAGLGAFFVCDYFGVPIGVTAAGAGLCGYMGGRAIEVAERYLKRRVDRAA
jgi:hypothetical protein